MNEDQLDEDRSLSRPRVDEPRGRILEAMLEEVCERGFSRTTVRAVAARARVSSATFYSRFASLEDCYAAVIDLGLAHGRELIGEAFEGQERWQDGVRAALAALLLFVDSEPLLARAWFVDSLAVGRWALERRERHTSLLEAMILERWRAPGEQAVDPAGIASAMASVLGSIHRHLVIQRAEPAISLLGPLTGVIVGRYLDLRETEREVRLAAAFARAVQAPRDPEAPLPSMSPPPGEGIAAGRRLRECVLFLDRHPDASNSEIAAGIGVAHKSQISKLLGELSRRGLAMKRSQGAGRRNEWNLTPIGRSFASALLGQLHSRSALDPALANPPNA